VSELVEKLFAIHSALTEVKLAHAFGGAIALAYCTQEPRGTRDLDINIFSAPSAAEQALRALPDEIGISADDVEMAAERGQRRLWWRGTPIDVFLSSMPFHEEVAKRALWVPLAGRTIPVVDCASLVVFKALIDRTRDWADIEACVAVCSPVDMAGASIALAELLDEDDPRLDRLKELRRSALPIGDRIGFRSALATRRD
jgi:hypothetical protein